MSITSNKKNKRMSQGLKRQERKILNFFIGIFTKRWVRCRKFCSLSNGIQTQTGNILGLELLSLEAVPNFSQAQKAVVTALIISLLLKRSIFSGLFRKIYWENFSKLALEFKKAIRFYLPKTLCFKNKQKFIRILQKLLLI